MWYLVCMSRSILLRLLFKYILLFNSSTGECEFLVVTPLLQLYQREQRRWFPSRIAGMQASTSDEAFIRAGASYAKWEMVVKMEKGKRNTLK